MLFRSNRETGALIALAFLALAKSGCSADDQKGDSFPSVSARTSPNRP